MPLVTLRPDRFAAGGEAIAREDSGRIVFVRGALPGETVEAELTTEKRDWARGHVVGVIDASPDRVVPPCPSRRAGCGGCGWQHITIDAQRDARVGIVADALRRTGGITDPLVERGGGVAPTGYRTTVRVAATAEGVAGFRAEQTHDVVPAPECLVAHPALAALLPRLRIDPGVEPTLRVSVATGELAARWDRGTGDVTGLPEGTPTGPGAVLHEDVAGQRLQVSMASFFQSGPQAAELLVATVRRAAPELDGARVVVDAYAGVGMLAACATDPLSKVIAIETSRSAVSDAERNLGHRDALVVRGEVGGWHAEAGTEVDVVLADPARSGLGKPGVAALTRLEAPVLVLVSCDAASLGRDAKLLASAGYRHERSELVDTFPHTTHIEAVTRFTAG
ncbi:MAG TPA: TRAM domain-containing protein [Ilumatobacteraceae bacterium]|nr:TRAM domain-containing protein [Ilumatobacteraceae bacterium]